MNPTKIGKMVDEYEKKHPKCMYYLTDYNKKKIKGEKMSMSNFIKRLKKDVNKPNFIKQCKAMSKQAKGKKVGGQRGGGWITAKFFVTFTNVTMGLSAIYIICTGSAAQTTMMAGFTALVTGNCNTFSEGTFRWMGLGNPVCNAYSSALTNVLLAVTGDPTAIAKITGVMVVIMKAPRWAPRLHCSVMKKLAAILVLGGVMEDSQLEEIENMYSSYNTGPTAGPTFQVLDE
jgi:hypothetical protein